MAGSVCYCNAVVMTQKIAGRSSCDRKISTSRRESAAQSLTSATARESTSPSATPLKDRSVEVFSNGYVRWASLAAAAAVGVSLLSAAPDVRAAEWEVSTGPIQNSIPGDVSLSIAIPIPNPDTWNYSQYGFLARPPVLGGELAVVSNYQGGCPPWQPSQFEMIVPDGVHPKLYPRHGSQWPALYMLEEATIRYQAFDSKDPSIKYASLIDALLRMTDAGLTCFSL